MGAYSSDKAASHPQSLLMLRRGQQPYPVHVQLVISDYCNQNCNFCAYRTEGYSSNALFKVVEGEKVNYNPRRMIPWDKLKEIVADCKAMKVRAIQITGGGEPTVHPHFDDLVALILAAGIDVAVVTNGLLMSQKRAELLARCAWVRVSIDCASEDSYAAIRRVPKEEFEIVKRNVRRLCSVPGRTAYVGIGYTVTRDNCREVLEGCKLAKDLGADNIRVSAVFQNDDHHYFDAIERQIVDDLDTASYLNDEKFRIFNNFQARYSDLEQGRPDYQKCHYMQFTTYVGGDQNVYVCCVNSYNDRGLIGSLAEQSFLRLWQSHTKEEMFEEFDARDCDRCMFNEKNRRIDALVREPQSHDNFV